MPSVDPSYHYVWLIWASVFLLPWTVLFVARPAIRRRMLWASALTAPFGLTELLFVPAYWNPPSLFDLAHRTGLDVESLILCFAIGGLAAAGDQLVPGDNVCRVCRLRSAVPGTRDVSVVAKPAPWVSVD